MAEIDGVMWRIVPFPDRLEWFILAIQFADGMGDGVADQHQVIVSSFDRRDLFRMACARGRGRKIRVPWLG